MKNLILALTIPLMFLCYSPGNMSMDHDVLLLENTTGISPETELSSSISEEDLQRGNSITSSQPGCNSCADCDDELCTEGEEGCATFIINVNVNNSGCGRDVIIDTGLLLGSATEFVCSIVKLSNTSFEVKINVVGYSCSQSDTPAFIDIPIAAWYHCIPLGMGGIIEGNLSMTVC